MSKLSLELSNGSSEAVERRKCILVEEVISRVEEVSCSSRGEEEILLVEVESGSSMEVE